VGVIEIFKKAGDSLDASMLIRAERIRAKLREQRDQFVASHEADWEIEG
jgi:hypothetical protein